MRVGHVIGQLTAGGAEGQLRLLTTSASRRSTPFVYCLQSEIAEHGRLLTAAGVPVRAVGGGRLRRVLRLRDLMAADRVNIVHSWLFIGNAYAWIGNGRRRPLVTSARNCKRQGAVLDALNRRAFSASDAIVVNSRLVEEYIRREYDAPAARVRVVHNGIDLERFNATARRAPGAEPVIVGIGRVVRQKNPELFVRAAGQLMRTVPNARFRWVGDGELRERVVRELAMAGLSERICFEGERHDIEEILGSADLLWLTSDWEGLPNVVLEAMAMGVPVVATDVGGTCELFPTGGEGVLVAPGDADAIAAASRRLLQNEALYASASESALKAAKEFAVPVMVEKMERVYEEVMGRF